MDLDKVRDRAYPKPINNVSDSAARYHAISERLGPGGWVEMPEEIDEHQRRDNWGDIRHARIIPESAPHETRIPFMSKEEKRLLASREGNATLRNRTDDNLLRDLIGDHDEREDRHYPSKLSLASRHEICL